MLQPCKPNRVPTAPPANLTVHPLHTQLCTHSTSCKPALLQLHPRGKPLRSASVLRVQNSDNPGAIYFFVCCLALLLLSLFFFLIKVNTAFTMSTNPGLSIPLEKEKQAGAGRKGHAPSLQEPPPIPGPPNHHQARPLAMPQCSKALLAR